MKTNKAFTLVELIIVIAVIGVLAAILIPVFSNVIDKANAKSALSDAKNSMEQVIIDAADNQTMPENIVVIVRKAQNFYVYGFNRLTDDRLYQSPGNPFRGFSDVQALIAARSWNALQGDTAPDLDTAYTDHDTYGYFYLVPYSSGVSQAPAVRAFRATYEYPEISDPTNGLMTENMGDDVHIYHGVLTDKINVNEQTDGNASATPAVVASPTTEPAQAEAVPVLVRFDYTRYDGGPINPQNPSDDRMGDCVLNLYPGDNTVSLSTIEERMYGHVLVSDYKDNLGYKPIAVVEGDPSLTPLESITIHFDPATATYHEYDGIYINPEPIHLCIAVVPRDDAPTDNSSLLAGRYPVMLHFLDAGDQFVTEEMIYLNLTPGTNKIYRTDLVDAGLWPDCNIDGYHYVIIQTENGYALPNNPIIGYVELELQDERQITGLEVNVYVKPVEDI